MYPDVGLKDARDKLDEVRKQLASNVDPSECRKAEKAAPIEKVENTFEAGSGLLWILKGAESET